MKPKTLKALKLDYSPEGITPDPNWTPPPLPPGRIAPNYFGAISGVVSSMNMLQIHFAYGLRALKLQMSDPPACEVLVQLTRQARPEPFFERGFLFVDREYDPVKLLDMPYDAKVRGEFSIDCWEWGADQLERTTDFPADFVRKSIALFRHNNYAVEGVLGEQKIVGSKAKARIHGSVSATRTILRVKVTHRGQELFERVIWDVPEQAFNGAYERRTIVVEDGQFKVLGARWFRDHFMLPEAAFPLDSLPEAFRKTLTS
ncbi:MAG: hypothetical protein KDE03_17235 [Rhodobacteraceae bacterium]|nr:hypothetical protein [Paracoccaceae bacterium]